MGEELELQHAKKIAREALPAGAGDYTVTEIAKAMIEYAKGREQRFDASKKPEPIY